MLIVLCNSTGIHVLVRRLSRPIESLYRLTHSKISPIHERIWCFVFTDIGRERLVGPGGIRLNIFENMNYWIYRPKVEFF